MTQIKKKRQSEIVAHLKKEMNDFIEYPPTGDFDKGYLQALLDIKKWIKT